VDERDRGGRPVWVAGPALVHSRARADMTWFVRNGFVGAFLAGNAVAVHDIEASIFGTTLGMSGTGQATAGGHGLHMRAINRVRAAGSIAEAVRQGAVRDGIMHALVECGVPFVLCGSIRDDGPLPDVIPDALAAQDAMRRECVRATMAVLIATALHAIATGNMLPAFVMEGEPADGPPYPALRELPTICVDSSEFVVSKLKDRGTHQAFGVVTNAQDFMHILRLYVERELDARARAAATAGPAAYPAAGAGRTGGGRGRRRVTGPAAAGGPSLGARLAAASRDDAVRERFLRAVLAEVPLGRVAEVHVFAPMRQGGVETGVAVVAARLEVAEGAEAPEGPVADAPARHTVYTARYRLVVKGPDRGRWQVDVRAEADAPLLTVDAVVRGVQRRAGDASAAARLDAAECARAAGLEPVPSGAPPAPPRRPGPAVPASHGA
jgi:hypothetical protein